MRVGVPQSILNEPEIHLFALRFVGAGRVFLVRECAVGVCPKLYLYSGDSEIGMLDFARNETKGTARS